jgi:hypothetical protein
MKPTTAVLLLLVGWINAVAAMMWFSPAQDVLNWIGPATTVWFVVAALAAVLSVASWCNILERMKP